MKNLKFVYTTGVVIAVIALLILSIADIDYLNILKYTTIYLFSFLTMFFIDFAERKGMGRPKKQPSMKVTRYLLVFYWLWVCILSTIIYTSIVNRYLPFENYSTMINLGIALFFACLFAFAVSKSVKATNSPS